METRDLSPADIADIFGNSSQRATNAAPAFGGGIDNPTDLFPTPVATPTPVADVPIPANPEEKKTEPVEELKEDVDILGDNGAPTPPPTEDKKVEIKGLSDYYQDRLKTGNFVEITEEDEKGNKKVFVPQTPEEFDEVIEMQVNYKLEAARKDLETKWYDSKSPAWKLVSQYAEMVDDPSQLIPFLQGVKNIQTVASLNEEDAEQAEQIVRTRLEQRGDPDEVIKTQIESLKASDNLLSTAKKIKPIMVQEEQATLSRQVQEARAQEQQYLQIVNDIREKAHQAIEQPLFGKIKLKQDEKAAIYDLIAYPSEETQGYGIYTAIDKLFDTKDFGFLAQVALFISKKDAFLQYLGTDVANQTSANLRKKLAVAGEMRSSPLDKSEPQDHPSIQRNSFPKAPRFGK